MVTQGNTHTQETKSKIAAGLKGHAVSIETREKIAAALRQDPKPCRMEDCDRHAVAQSLCPMHYHRQIRYGDPTFRKRVQKKVATPARTCMVDGCERPHYGIGWCRPHYDRVRKLGDPGPTTFKKQARASQAERTAARRRYWIKSMYGITLEEYDALLVAQGGGCAICHSTEPGGKAKYLPVDHCHDTGLVRGLLCTPCNTALGRFKDNPDRLASAISYLTRIQVS